MMRDDRPAASYDGQRRIVLHSEVRVVTENSLWLLRPTVEAAWYQRMPRHEGPRGSWEQTGGRLSDGSWMPMRRCWLVPWGAYATDAVRVLPGLGPIRGFGIHSSGIESMEGDFDLVDEDEPLSCAQSFWQAIESPHGPVAWLRFTDLEPDKETRAKHRVELFEDTRFVKTWDLWNTRADGYQALVEAAVGSIRWAARP